MIRRRLPLILPALALVYLASLFVFVKSGGAYVAVASWSNGSTEFRNYFPNGQSSGNFHAYTHSDVRYAGERWSNPATGKNFWISQFDAIGPTRGTAGSTSFAAAGWPDVPGANQNNGCYGCTISWFNLYLNSDWSWNYTCTMDEAGRNADTLVIALHEFGHAVKLDHDWYHQEAVMWPNYTCKTYLRTDDLNGIDALY